MEIKIFSLFHCVVAYYGIFAKSNCKTEQHDFPNVLLHLLHFVIAKITINQFNWIDTLNNRNVSEDIECKALSWV